MARLYKQTHNGPYSDINPYMRLGAKENNCTCYAWEREYDLTGIAPLWVGAPYRNTKNTSIWNIKDGYKRRGPKETPVVGDDAIFDNGDDGHIAVVEEVKANGDIVISEGSYSTIDAYSYKYKERTLTKASGYRHPYGPLVGFKATAISVMTLNATSQKATYTKNYSKAVRDDSQYDKPDGKHYWHTYYMNKNVTTYKESDGKKSGTLKKGKKQLAYAIDRKDAKGNRLARFYSNGHWHTFVREKRK